MKLSGTSRTPLPTGTARTYAGGDDRFRNGRPDHETDRPEEGLSDSGATHPHRQRTPGPGWRLTKREQEVARLVFEGKSNREIADILVISPRTAEAHVEHILSKLGFVSRLQIARWVADHGHPRPKSACGDLEGRRTVALR
jgi:DNA-binding CsgD family transcriptional regulator